MLSGLMLPVGLCVVAFFLIAVLLKGKKARPTNTPSIVPTFAPFTEHRQTAREQDRDVQAALASKFYAEAMDERFKQQTLDDLAEILNARKPK
jgi:hypothetical protein